MERAMSDELYRFVQLRGAVPANVDDDLLIFAWSDPPSELETTLVNAADPPLMADAFLDDLAPFNAVQGLRRLAAEIDVSASEITAVRFRESVRRIMDVEHVVNTARLAAQDLLAAVVVSRSASSELRSEAHRLVVLAVASQRALRLGEDQLDTEEERRDRDQRLRRFLDLGRAVLSPGISRLLVPRPVAPPAGGGGDDVVVVRPPGGGGDVVVVRPPGWNPFEQQVIRDKVLTELVAIATDPEIPRVVIPAIENPPDEQTSRLRRTAEISMRPPRVVLEGEVLDRLSQETREVLHRIAPGQTDVLSVIDVVDRAGELSAPIAANVVAPTNDPTGGFPQGYGALRRPLDGLVRPPGIGTLMSVRAEHARYVLGAITYIENVLAGETRKRTHRRLDRTEEMTFAETERSVVDEQDLQRTERFDLVIETMNEVNSQTQVQVGAQVSGSYGTVQASASFGFTSSTAMTDATRTATTTARETVDRALKRITERTLERRQRITIREVEETNLHELIGGEDGNRSGIYHFVDDEQTVGVYSYGTRLMFEVHVPEPGAFLRWARAANADTANDPEPPLPALPDGTRLTSHNQIDQSNYPTIAGRYGAAVEAPPQVLRTVAIAERQEYTQNTPQASTPAYLFYRSYERLQVPEGYQAKSASGVIYASAWMADVQITVGTVPIRGTTPGEAMPFPFSMALPNGTGIVPIAMTITNAWGFAFTIEMVCERTARALEQWQVRTFNAIMQAYDSVHSAWEERQRAASITDVIVTGINPAINRQIERGELKKGIISILAGSPLHSFGAVTQPGSGEPTIDPPAAVGQSGIISFYEQAFEWENIMYSLYPYFWGRHGTWRDAFGENGADATHEAFLRAGLARVVVPVRVGFEDVALWFLSTGQIWYGGSPPPISNIDPLYRSVAAELLALDEASRGGTLLGSTWPTVTPTNLVYLGNDVAALNPAPA
jgi:hypothetical protein